MPVACADDTTTAHQSGIDSIITPTSEAVAEVGRDVEVLDLDIEAKAADEVRDSTLADKFIDRFVVVRGGRLAQSPCIATSNIRYRYVSRTSRALAVSLLH